MAMNIAVLNTVYNHYLTSYAPKGTTQYDTHKKSELRSIYNSIVKQNKEAPLSIVDTSEAAQRFAVSVKENARELRNTIASLGGLDENEMLGKKKASSTNEDIATATYIGESGDDEIPSFELEVTNLAKPQYNTGNYLPKDDIVDMSKDLYSFDIRVNDMSYEFQFNVKPEDTNGSLQKKLANLVNNANISLQAEVLEDGEGNSSLQIRSNLTGLAPEKREIFRISEEKTSKNTGILDYLGIGDITRPAENAQFKLNGVERTALSNRFTVEKKYEIQLTGVSPEEGMSTTIGVKTDIESLKDNIIQLVGSYNAFIKSANEYLESQPQSNRLLGEMNRIASYYNQSLGRLGLQFGENGDIFVDETLLDNAAQSDNPGAVLEPVKDFTNSLLRKANQVSLNPMNYVNKTIVAYKNPGHNFVSPYAASAYSGMMFNSYC